ncbi:hypothetical protein CPAR01_09298 [Colletotrichum paranaense]|uniref:Uncharacterized protein n=1 Tax=Colletotrichum paranaense TaxID=1914294 RepID=A0ABQ9SH27_9PEZI|nr:uncharacterized protein CPAR01_09298 [Colletotrichum paranaense]KAK1535756.1 hypothetical protein CPAR01_09298 [Colletotrichum paranaense]
MRPSDVNPQSVSRYSMLTLLSLQQFHTFSRPLGSTSTARIRSARFSQLSGGPPQTRSLVLACGGHPPSKIKSNSRLVLQWKKNNWASVVMALRPRSLASSASNPRSRKRARGCTSVWYIWQPYTHCQENTSGLGSIFTNVLDRELRPMDRFSSHTSKFILASPDPSRK